LKSALGIARLPVHEVVKPKKVLVSVDKVCLFYTVSEDPDTEVIVWIFVACVHTCSRPPVCMDVMPLTNSADKDLMCCYFYLVTEELILQAVTLSNHNKQFSEK